MTSSRDFDGSAARRLRRRAAVRRRIRRRRLLLGSIAVALAVTLIVLVGTGGGTTRSRSRTLAAQAASASPEPRAKARPSTTPTTPAPSGPSPGSLPQTHAYPSGRTAQFRALMGELWAGIQRDSVSAALPAFFPRGAYVQLKAIPGAGSDWSERLVHDYHLDISAAHSLLGRGAATARLVTVDVPSGYGHWVPPGACYNDIGYYEMPNARIVYREYGATRSLGIASMISWRGVWYVVHLGAILRSEDVGVVDEPSAGSGTSLYSGTC